jgi:hypothetical protein
VDWGVEGLDVTGVEVGDEVEGADVADVEAGGELEEAIGAGGGDGGDPTTTGMPGTRLAGSCTLPPDAEIVSESPPRSSPPTVVGSAVTRMTNGSSSEFWLVALIENVGQAKTAAPPPGS